MATPATPMPEAKPLGTAARILNTFIAPSETFMDLKRNTSWWAAFLLIALSGYVMMYAVSSKVGWEQVMDNAIKQSPKAAEKLDQMPADQRARVVNAQIAGTKYVSYALPVVQLIIFVVMAAVLMGTFNFGLGAQVNFKTSLAVTIFAQLPGVIKALLVALTLFLGANPENFLIDNPLGSNPGYFMSIGSSPVLNKVLSSLDIFAIWIIVLTGLGFACVSKVKKGSAIGVVAGWYIFLTLLGVAKTALFG